MIKYISSFLELVAEDVKLIHDDRVDNFFKKISTNPKFQVLPEYISTAATVGNDLTMRFQMYNMILSMRNMFPSTTASKELDTAALSQLRPKKTKKQATFKVQQDSGGAVDQYKSQKLPKTGRPKVQQKSLPMGQQKSIAYLDKEKVDGNNKATATMTNNIAANMLPPLPPAAPIMSMNRNMAVGEVKQDPHMVLPPSQQSYHLHAPPTASPSLILAAQSFGLDPALVYAAMNLTPEEIMLLPPEKKQEILALRQQMMSAMDLFREKRNEPKGKMSSSAQDMVTSTKIMEGNPKGEGLKASAEPKLAPNSKMKGKSTGENLHYERLFDSNTFLANNNLLQIGSKSSSTDKHSAMTSMDKAIRNDYDDLFTPPKNTFLKTPPYSNYLSSVQSSNSSLSVKEMTIQEQTVAVPITDPLILVQINALKTKLRPTDFQEIFKNNHAFGIGAQHQGKSKRNTFSIIFNYTGLHDVECTLDQLIQYAKYSSLFETKIRHSA
jgi:hypothetical protein